MVFSSSGRATSFNSNLYLLVAATTSLALALIELLELFELPLEPAVGHLFASGSLISVQLVTSSLMAFGYGGLFILMFLESASLPVPSEVILPFAGYLVFTGDMNFELVLIVGTVAGVSGALLDYYLALKLGRPVVVRAFRLLGVKKEHFERAETWLDHRGSWSVLVARFIPGLRSAISLPAGALAMKRGPFVIMTTIGAFGWTVLLVALGYSAGPLWQTALTKSAPGLVEAGLICVALASSAYIVYFVSLKLSPRRSMRRDN